MKINYKVFNTNKEFLDWQDAPKGDLVIVDMVPVVTYSNSNHEFENNTNLNNSETYNSIGIFVTYTENVNSTTEKE